MGWGWRARASALCNASAAASARPAPSITKSCAPAPMTCSPAARSLPGGRIAITVGVDPTGPRRHSPSAASDARTSTNA